MKTTLLPVPLSALLALALTGCVVAPVERGHGHGVYHESIYGPAHVDVIPPRPGVDFIWIDGSWHHDHRGRRSWDPGRWAPPHHGWRGHHREGDRDHHRGDHRGRERGDQRGGGERGERGDWRNDHRNGPDWRRDSRDDTPRVRPPNDSPRAGAPGQRGGPGWRGEAPRAQPPQQDAPGANPRQNEGRVRTPDRPRRENAL